MRPIAKDTPVGTRVIVVDFNVRARRTRTTGLVSALDYVDWIGVTTADRNLPVPISTVYLDEPAPGTFDWACHTALAGNTVRSKSAEAEFWYESGIDAFVKRGPGTKLEIANPSKAHVLARHADWDAGAVLGRGRTQARHTGFGTN